MLEVVEEVEFVEDLVPLVEVLEVWVFEDVEGSLEFVDDALIGDPADLAGGVDDGDRGGDDLHEFHLVVGLDVVVDGVSPLLDEEAFVDVLLARNRGWDGLLELVVVDLDGVELEVPEGVHLEEHVEGLEFLEDG